MFTYNLSDTEYLVFKTQRDCFEVFSAHEGGGADMKKIATYQGGRWLFESFEQQKMFWFLFNMFKYQFGKAMKAYSRSLVEKPQTYVFTCAKRRFDIKVQKIKRGWDNWFYGLYSKR